MPVIWLIDAYRAGERGQVRALVDALGWPCETKVLQYRSHVFLPHVLGQSTLRGISAESAATLAPPWPDLVISCGVRNEPVCRWIRAQSGGRTRYVHVGRPCAAFDTGQPHVEDLDSALAVEKQVGRFYIAVGDSLLVGVLKASGSLENDVHRMVDR